MDAEVRAAVIARAGGRCEHCGEPLTHGELDHMFGRAKALESVANCWMLLPACHFAKTRNSPDAATWLRRFIEHQTVYGYDTTRAIGKLAWAEAKAAFAR